MSWKFADLIYEYELTPVEQNVLVIFARRAQPDGTKSYPSIDRVVWETNLSKRTVQRVVRSFVNRGVLVRTELPGFHRPTTYRLVLSRLVRKSPFVSGMLKGASLAPIKPEPKGDTDAEKGVTGDEKGDSVTPERSLETSLETRAGKNSRVGRFDQLCAIGDCDGRGRGAHSLCVKHLGLQPARDTVA